MLNDVARLIESIHGSTYQFALAMTGGGASAGSMLLGVPGASRTILEVQVPYSEPALVRYLGKVPDQFCSAQTAIDMAEVAFVRAVMLSEGATHAGLGCTASLVSNRPKRGEHRFFVAAVTATATSVYSLRLEKGARSRLEEEEVVSRTFLKAMANAAHLSASLPLQLRPSEQLEVQEVTGGVLTRFFQNSDRLALHSDIDGKLSENHEHPRILLSGSFNPVHAGHWAMAEIAAREIGAQVTFEMSVVNVDKPELHPDDARRRLLQFHGRAPAWLTRTPTFIEKARQFPGTTFVLGSDTAARLFEPRYYGDSHEERDKAATAFREAGCRFLVIPRACGNGPLVGLEDLTVPVAFAGLFDSIRKEDFSWPVSSTDLRARTRSS